MKISVILVHYNAQDLIEKSIQSVLNHSCDIEFEFLICDNSSNLKKTDFLKHTPRVIISDLGFNAGFSKGVNSGLLKATGEYILILNQDAAIIDKDTFITLINKAKKLPEKTILGCRLIDKDNKHQQSIWLDNPFITREWKQGPIYTKLKPGWKNKFEDEIRKIHELEGFVPRINGAFLFFKKPIDIKTILFDEDFFLYGEDIEWALRMKKQEYKFYHVPSITVLHLGSASTDNVWLRTLQITISDWLVTKKNKGAIYLVFQYLLIIFNFRFDRILLFLAKVRGKEIDKNVSTSSIQKFMLLSYLLKKYAFKVLLHSGSFYLKNEFILNCYKNDKQIAEKIRNKGEI